jgi:hypothetical protein
MPRIERLGSVCGRPTFSAVKAASRLSRYDLVAAIASSLDGAIMADQPVAKLSQSSAAAIGAASTGLDNRIAKTAIHVLN